MYMMMANDAIHQDTPPRLRHVEGEIFLNGSKYELDVSYINVTKPVAGFAEDAAKARAN